MIAKRVLSGVAALAGLFVGTNAQAAGPFYDGKTITFLVGQAPGGGGDLTCRLIADHLASHIPGNPTIIVKNVTGGDGMNAINFVGQEPRKEGLNVYCGAYNPSTQLVGNPALQVDLTKFYFICADGDADITYVAADVPPGVKTKDDVLKVSGKDLVLAGLAVNSGKDIMERISLDILGFKGYRYVTGFAGAAPVRAAIQQHFINIFQDGMSSYIKVAEPTMAKTGEIVPLFQSGLLDANGVPNVPDTRAAGVPTLGDFYKAHFGKAPTGLAFDLYQRQQALNDVALFAVMLPPGSPPEAVTAMRNAVEPMNKDPDFIDISNKLRGEGSVETDGLEVQKLVDQFLHMPPDEAKLFKDMVASGAVLAQQGKK